MRLPVYLHYCKNTVVSEKVKFILRTALSSMCSTRTEVKPTPRSGTIYQLVFLNSPAYEINDHVNDEREPDVTVPCPKTTLSADISASLQ